MIKKQSNSGSQQLVPRIRATQTQTGSAGNAPGRLGVGFGSIGFNIATLAGSTVETQLVLPTIARKIKGFAFAPSSPFVITDLCKFELDNQVFIESQAAVSLIQNGELWYYTYERNYYNNSVFKVSLTTAAAENVNLIVYYES